MVPRLPNVPAKLPSIPPKELPRVSPKCASPTTSAHSPLPFPASYLALTLVPCASIPTQEPLTRVFRASRMFYYVNTRPASSCNQLVHADSVFRISPFPIPFLSSTYPEEPSLLPSLLPFSIFYFNSLNYCDYDSVKNSEVFEC